MVPEVQYIYSHPTIYKYSQPLHPLFHGTSLLGTIQSSTYTSYSSSSVIASFLQTRTKPWMMAVETPVNCDSLVVDHCSASVNLASDRQRTKQSSTDNGSRNVCLWGCHQRWLFGSCIPRQPPNENPRAHCTNYSSIVKWQLIGTPQQRVLVLTIVLHAVVLAP